MKQKTSRSRVGAAVYTAALIALSAPRAVPAATPADAGIIVANDRADDVRALLAQGWNPNTRIKGQPAIMQAMRDNAWHVYDLLAADPRTDVNAANDQGETPLMYLAILGQTQRARTLIARGAQVNRLGWTPLHYAASKGQMDMAKLLLADKAIVNAPGTDGTTPLMMAGYSGSRDMVELLLKAGADATMRNTQGLDAAAWAASAQHADLAQLLARTAAERQAQLSRLRGNDTVSPPAAAPAAGFRPAPAAANPAPAAPPAAAPSPGTPPDRSPDQGSRMLQGVGGIRLDSFGDDTR
jgi:ankyrin repeat protein